MPNGILGRAHLRMRGVSATLGFSVNLRAEQHSCILK